MDMEKIIYVNQCRINLTIEGSGEPLLFLHGNGEDHNYFQQQREVFNKYFQCIYMDSRGHGESDLGTSGLTLTLMAEDVIKVIEALNLSSVNVLGFSDGANIAILAALKQPRIFKTMILNGANINPKGLKTSIYLSMLKEYMTVRGVKKELLSLMINEPQLKFDDLKKIQCPTLVIAGERDMIKTSHTKMIAASIPNAQLVIIPNADHFCAFKQASKFNEMVLDFLNNK